MKCPFPIAFFFFGARLVSGRVIMYPGIRNNVGKKLQEASTNGTNKHVVSSNILSAAILCI